MMRGACRLSVPPSVAGCSRIARSAPEDGTSGKGQAGSQEANAAAAAAEPQPAIAAIAGGATVDKIQI
eukprot:5571245-Pyramimonas_sp.AAC.2